MIHGYKHPITTTTLASGIPLNPGKVQAEIIIPLDNGQYDTPTSRVKNNEIYFKKLITSIDRTFGRLIVNLLTYRYIRREKIERSKFEPLSVTCIFPTNVEDGHQYIKSVLDLAIWPHLIIMLPQKNINHRY